MFWCECCIFHILSNSSASLPFNTVQSEAPTVRLNGPQKPCNATVQAQCFQKTSHTRAVVCPVVDNMALSGLGVQRYRACADVWTIQQSSNNANSLWSNAVDVMWVSLEAQQIKLTACFRRLWPTGIGNLTSIFWVGIYKRKAGSESLLQRQRQRIGGRDKTNTLPLTTRVQSRLVHQLF